MKYIIILVIGLFLVGCGGERVEVVKTNTPDTGGTVETKIKTGDQEWETVEDIYIIEGSSDDYIALKLTQLKLEFNSKSYDDKVDIVNNGYFYTCSQVEDFCNENPNIDGCIKYCGED